MNSHARCALCNCTQGPLRSAVPLVKGVACADCWPHVDKFRVRNATPSIHIEAVRNGAKCYVNELIDSDFENMVWTAISYDPPSNSG